MFDELSRSMRALRMVVEIEGRGERVVKPEFGVHRLGDLVGRAHFIAGAVDAGSQAPGEQNDGPIPVENLCAEDKEEHGASKREHGGKGRFVDEQVTNLAPPSAADQVRKCVVLTHLLIMPEKRVPVPSLTCPLAYAWGY